jgi:CDK-activating kinase assembly factor MAT1
LPCSFNRKEQDFASLDAYNDYLEMVETYSGSHVLVFHSKESLSAHVLVFNLTNKINVEETEEKITQYREANKDLISKNRGKLVEGVTSIFLRLMITRSCRALMK